MTVNNDTRLLSLDFIAEIGDMLSTGGAAIAAAASAERYDVLEFAFRQVGNALADGLAEYRAIAPKEGGPAHD